MGRGSGVGDTGGLPSPPLPALLARGSCSLMANADLVHDPSPSRPGSSAPPSPWWHCRHPVCGPRTRSLQDTPVSFQSFGLFPLNPSQLLLFLSVLTAEFNLPSLPRIHASTCPAGLPTSVFFSRLPHVADYHSIKSIQEVPSFPRTEADIFHGAGRASPARRPLPRGGSLARGFPVGWRLPRPPPRLSSSPLRF